MIKRGLLFIGLLMLLIACSSSGLEVTDDVDTTDSTNASKPNILLVIADDMGLDATPNYPEGTIKPNMPNLQSLMNSGVRFTNLWSYPVCSPTRASILTGKYGSKTGVQQVGDVISTTESSIQSFLKSNTANAYTSAIIGKWHLSNNASDPTTMGIDYFAGILNGGVQSYTNWNFTENNVTSNSTEYTTTKFTDLAIDWIDKQTKPWFLWLAYNAPHTPFHLAPSGLHSQGNLPTDSGSIDANPMPYYMSAIEALDTELGRLLSSLTPEEKANTLIIFIGDNGSPNQVAQSPYSRRKAKNSLYQGGVNVPMVVSGYGVTRTNDEENALVHTTDLFTTIVSAAGVSTNSYENSTSFYDLLSSANSNKRTYTYTEIISGGIKGYAIRNEDYKLIKYENGDEEFYQLSNDAYENANLLLGGNLTTQASNAKAELEAEAIRIQS
jgi:arylsulfatase A-like enzyme